VENRLEAVVFFVAVALSGKKSDPNRLLLLSGGVCGVVIVIVVVVVDGVVDQAAEAVIVNASAVYEKIASTDRKRAKADNSSGKKKQCFSDGMIAKSVVLYYLSKKLLGSRLFSIKTMLSKLH